ncbi:MAG: GFA family protein [Pseudomonadota bacterium]
MSDASAPELPVPDMPKRGTGRCLCGAVTFAWSARPLWAGHCHCETCRRTCSAPVTSFFGVANGAWEWTGAKPLVFSSSPGRRRYFCGTCGSPMAYEGDHFPDEIHFYAAAMDNPEDFDPRNSFHRRERLSWLHMEDPA